MDKSKKSAIQKAKTAMQQSKKRKKDGKSILSTPNSMHSPQLSSHHNSNHSTPEASSAHATDAEEEEEEDFQDYCPGGYHPVKLNESYKNGRYITTRKLGWGHFSTVWLARDTQENRHVALKVVRSATHYTETAVDEIKLCQKIATADPSHPGHAHVVSLLDQFEHEGENLLGLIKRYEHRGIPVAVVKQITRQILLGLEYLHRECGIIHTDLKPENVLIAIDDVEAVARAAASQTAEEMKHTHEPGKRRPRFGRIITGSQPLPSPASVSPHAFSSFLNVPATNLNLREGEGREGSTMAKERQRVPDTVAEDKKAAVFDSYFHGAADSTASMDHQKTADGITDFVSNISLESDEHDIANKHTSKDGLHGNDKSTHDLGTMMSAATNENGKMKDSASIDLSKITVKIADLGNACWTHHHFTNDIQTRQYRAPEVILGARWGASADCWSMACMVFELLTGDYLFDPKAGKTYEKDDDHMAQIEELLGHFPRHIALSGKFSNELFNKKGVLRKIEKLNMWSLCDVLHDKYKCSWNDAEQLANFLTPMLNLNASERATAEKQLQDPWVFDSNSDTNVRMRSDNEPIPGWAQELKENSLKAKIASKNPVAKH
ncbi:protein of unknown function [Taphrina deformans PYCC 5710]|uniref:non-specific serine/threonine protein kinase n=1 Tax=Taphrina deformans (strain PYCC 5710 / ATCC 11124 / CBS 356.35 / IMI 108563 / JCM 9778 / NBRC 8474) TaxID=1097556 RepID=R4XEI2_TAPDE|nr:protein of unknown function [Taphrina deformans PYCC 5710]|eukprot:CCG84252.1 protein of unknown function [Taphrina deformans PYCC 5710]